MQNTNPNDNFKTFCDEYDKRHREGLAKNTRYSISKLKVCEFASHETDCFESKIVCAGQIVAHVSNDGQGGCDMIAFVGPNQLANDKAFEDYAKEIGFTSGRDFYSALHAQACKVKDEEKLMKKLQKLMPGSGKLAYFTPTQKKGAYCVLKTTMTLAQVKALKTTPADARFLTKSSEDLAAFWKHLTGKDLVLPKMTKLTEAPPEKIVQRMPKVLMPKVPAQISPSIQSWIDNPFRVNGVGCKDIFAAEAQVKLQKQVNGGPPIRIEKGGIEIKMTSFQSMCSNERRKLRAVAK